MPDQFSPAVIEYIGKSGSRGHAHVTIHEHQNGCVCIVSECPYNQGDSIHANTPLIAQAIFASLGHPDHFLYIEHYPQNDRVLIVDLRLECREIENELQTRFTDAKYLTGSIVDIYKIINDFNPHVCANETVDYKNN